ncbi:hypothetical protein KKI23_01325 [Patescibacteria group bacterium]|nr:hypothetical protein [Patescibacteria group bacterium]
MAKKRSIQTNKKRILLIVTAILCLAAIIKIGFFIYQNYWQEVDTIAQMVPAEAQYYAHFRLDDNKDPLKTYLIEAKEIPVWQGIEGKLNQKITALAENYGFDYKNSVSNQINKELALFGLGQDEQAVIFPVADQQAFINQVLFKIRGASELNQVGYQDVAIYNFDLAADSYLTELLNKSATKIFYASMGGKLVLGTSQNILARVIDTYQQSAQSVKDKIPAKYRNKIAYLYLEQEALSYLAEENSFQQLLNQYRVDEIFAFTEIVDGQLKISLASNQGIWPDLDLADPMATDLLTYIPDQFALALMEENLGDSLQDFSKNSLGSYLTRIDFNSLLAVTALIPEKKLLNNFSDNNALLIIDENNHYLLAIGNEPDQVTTNLDLLKIQLINISAYFNPATKEVVYDEQTALELLPDPDQVSLLTQANIGPDFWAIPFGQNNLYFGRENNNILISDSNDLLSRALANTKNNFWSDKLQQCQEAIKDEVVFWPINKITLPWLGEIATDSLLIATSSLESRRLSFSGCLF